MHNTRTHRKTVYLCQNESRYKYKANLRNGDVLLCFVLSPSFVLCELIIVFRLISLLCLAYFFIYTFQHLCSLSLLPHRCRFTCQLFLPRTTLFAEHHCVSLCVLSSVFTPTQKIMLPFLTLFNSKNASHNGNKDIFLFFQN